MRDYDFYPERQILIRVKKEKNPKPRKRFWIGLLIYAIILSVIAAGTLIFLWKTIAEYQEELDKTAKVEEYDEAVKRAPQEFFVSYVEGSSVDNWVNIWKENNTETLDTDETVKNTLSELFNPEAESFYKASDYSNENPAYIIRNGDRDIAKVTLSGSNLSWEVSEAEVYLSGDKTGKVTVPADSQVYCNGVEVPQSYIVSSSENEDMSDYSEDMVNPISYSSYEITGLLAEPVISVSGSHELVFDEEGNYMYVLSGEVSENTVKKATDFVSALLYYFKMGKQDTDSNMNSVLSHVVSDSKAAKVIRASYDGVIWTQGGKNVTYEVTTGDAIVHADNCVSVDVSYHSDDEDAATTGITDGTYRVYFLDKGKGNQIYNFELK